MPFQFLHIACWWDFPPPIVIADERQLPECGSTTERCSDFQTWLFYSCRQLQFYPQQAGIEKHLTGAYGEFNMVQSFIPASAPSHQTTRSCFRLLET